ncbi:MAG: Na/Pi cotransporter family protein [Candidatus Cloacimonas sp.]
MNLLNIINLIGGLALFLFGINKLSDSLQAVAGSEMRRILKVLINSPLKGVLVGLGVTALVQSSSATTVMTVGFVNTGIMTLNQAVGVIMGANIGTTITTQLIAFNIGQYAYLFIVLGVALLFIRKSRAMEHWSQIIIGFGLLFIGLNVMAESVTPLQNSVVAKNLMIQLASNPILSILVGTAFTMLIQSSAASIGIVMVLASTGLIPFEGALYLVFGDNIGTTITAWLAAITSSNTAKRVAMVHTLFNLFGTIIFATLTYLGIYPLLINWITPGNVYLGQNVARHIANGHTLFNIINTIFFLPFAGLLAKAATKIIPPDKVETISLGEPKHLNYTIINNSDLAIKQSMKEMREMLRLVRMELLISYQAFKDKDYKKQLRVSRIEKAIDNLQREITLYLVAVNEKTKAEDIIHKIPALLHSVNDIEKIGDFTEQINKILNEQMISQKHQLPPEFIKMIDDLHSKLLIMLDLSIDYLAELKEEYVYKIIEMEGRINETHHFLREDVLARIQNRECEAAGGLNIIDYLDEIEEIADKLKNLVKAGTHDFVYNHNYELEPDEEEEKDLY